MHYFFKEESGNLVSFSNTVSLYCSFISYNPCNKKINYNLTLLFQARDSLNVKFSLLTSNFYLNVIFENLVVHQDTTLQLMNFVILITCLHDIVLRLLGENSC